MQSYCDRRASLRQFAAIFVIAALADWLLFGARPGISVAIFFVIFGAGVLLANPLRTSLRRDALACGVLTIALLPIVEHYGVIPFLFGALGAAYFSLEVTISERRPIAQQLVSAIQTLVAGPVQFFADITRITKDSPLDALASGALRLWVMPLVLGGVFLILFSFANPVMRQWISILNLTALMKLINMKRVIFWVIVILLIWPFIIVKSRHPHLLTKAGIDRPSVPAPREPDPLFGSAAILRSLVVFNALFAVETGLDLTYLWAGATLPEGMSYASYAHRGAYPLMMTALLAGAFSIAAVRPGSQSEGSRWIRALLYLWVTQNVLLVSSSIMRLKAYVEFYSLTYWRVAAFLWMFLVAIGLCSIVLRIHCRRSDTWLISANIGSLSAILYLSAFVDFPSFVATYNVEHCREISGQGQLLDVAYLVGLGPDAIPAMDEYERRLQDPPSVARTALIDVSRRELLATRLGEVSNWRSWSFRDWRLSRYLSH